MISYNVLAMEELHYVAEYSGNWEVKFFRADDVKGFLNDKINYMCEGIQDLYEIFNGEAFDYDIVVDERGLELLHHKLIEKHRGL